MRHRSQGARRSRYGAMGANYHGRPPDNIRRNYLPTPYLSTKALPSYPSELVEVPVISRCSHRDLHLIDSRRSQRASGGYEYRHGTINPEQKKQPPKHA